MDSPRRGNWADEELLTKVRFLKMDSPRRGNRADEELKKQKEISEKWIPPRRGNWAEEELFVLSDISENGFPPKGHLGGRRAFIFSFW